MKYWKTALCLGLAFVIGACSRNDPAALVASAKEYIAKRDFNASIIQLKNALQKEPDNAEARYLLGVAALENADLSSAEIELGKARQLGYSGEDLPVALARMMLAKGEHAKVVSEFSGTKLSAPKIQAQLLAVIGTAELAQNHRTEAQSVFRQALALDPGSVATSIGLARLAASERDLAAANKYIDGALAAAPSNGEALLLKADLLAAQGQNEAAEKTYRQAVEALPAHVPPRLALISHLIRNGSLDKASAEVGALQKIAPKDPRSAYARAQLLGEQGNYAASREAILQVLKVAPNHVPSLMIAGIAAYRTRAYSEAESHFRKAVQYAPESVAAKRFLAASHLRMGQSDLALSELTELMERSGENPAVLMLAGEAALTSGNASLAAQYYEKAEVLAPQNATVQTRLALLRLATGDADRGLKELESVSVGHPDDYQADLALVATYLRKRDADKALEAVAVLEKKQPDNPLTHNLRGAALVLKADYSAARASFEHALKLNPAYMPAVSNLVQLDLRDKKPEAARKRYEAVLKKEPNNEQALLASAVLLRIIGTPQTAIEKLLRQAVAANPGSPNSRGALINFYLRNRDLPKAVAAAQEARAALPNNPAMTNALGTSQLAAGETKQAVATFMRLAEMAPKAPEPLVQLARAQLAAKQPDDAIKSLRAALSLRPDLTVVERDIAAIYVSTGRYTQALAEARRLQQQFPEKPAGYALEGEIYVAQKKFETAEHAYGVALKKFDHPMLAVRTHEIITAGGDPGRADAMAQKWVSAHPKDAGVLVYLAQRDLAAKRFGEAEKRFKAALARQPDNPVVLNNLAWVSNQLKEPKALEYAERANELAPGNPAIMDTLGWILAEEGQLERGLELLGRASELAPRAYNIRLNFAKALVKAGRKDAARKELQQLAKLDSKSPIQQEATALLAGL